MYTSIEYQGYYCDYEKLEDEPLWCGTVFFDDGEFDYVTGNSETELIDSFHNMIDRYLEE